MNSAEEHGIEGWICDHINQTGVAKISIGECL
jgi:hypothetical protein